MAFAKYQATVLRIPTIRGACYVFVLYLPNNQHLEPYTYAFVKHDLDNMTTILPGFPLETTNLTAIFGFFNITTIANTKIERTTAEKCMETTSNSYLNDALY